MEEREDLNREHSQLIVRKQELETQQKNLPPKEGETWVFSLEDLAKHEQLEREIAKVNNRLEEIVRQLRKLPPSNK